MAKKKIERGTKLVCIPCGREVVISNCGMRSTALWCCSMPMKKKTQSLIGRIKAKLARKKKR